MFNKAVIIMLFLTTAVVTEECIDDPCNIQEYCHPDGMFAPSPNDCYSYLYCEHGYWKEAHCHNELWFRYDTCVCDYNTTGPGCLLCPTTTPRPSLEPGTCEPVPEPCPTSGERFADQSGCEHFYECQTDGSLMRIQCAVSMHKCNTSGIPCLFDIHQNECLHPYTDFDCYFRCPGTTITTEVTHEATSSFANKTTQEDLSTVPSTSSVTTLQHVTTTQSQTTPDDETTSIPDTTRVSTSQSTEDTSPYATSTAEETSTHIDTTQITTDHETTYLGDTTLVPTLPSTANTYTSSYHQSTETTPHIDTTLGTTEHETTYRTDTSPVSAWQSTSETETSVYIHSTTEGKTTHMDATTRELTTVIKDTTSNIETTDSITTHPQTKTSTENTSVADTTAVTSQPTTESHRETTAYSSSTGHTSSQRGEMTDQTNPITEPTTPFADTSTPTNIDLEVWQIATLVAMSAAGAGILMGICFFAILAWNRGANDPCTDGDVSSLSSCDDRRRILESSQNDDAILFKPALFRSSSQWSEISQPPPFGRSMSIDSSQWRFSEEGMDTIKIRDQVSLVQNPVYYIGDAV